MQLISKNLIQFSLQLHFHINSKALFKDTKNKIKMINPKYYRTRSQDLDTFYHDAGQFYWFQQSNF